jgi:hypothetical protein
MLRLGITGHMNLTAPSTELVYRALVTAIRDFSGRTVHGVTCLAEGADQIFASAILANSGTFEVILPARDYRHYRRRIVRTANAPRFDELLVKATKVSYAGSVQSGNASYVAANRALLEKTDHLLAVWDGIHNGKSGGTADMVAMAEQMKVPVTRVWPPGAHRS